MLCVCDCMAAGSPRPVPSGVVISGIYGTGDCPRKTHAKQPTKQTNSNESSSNIWFPRGDFPRTRTKNGQQRRSTAESGTRRSYTNVYCGLLYLIQTVFC